MKFPRLKFRNVTCHGLPDHTFFEVGWRPELRMHPIFWRKRLRLQRRGGQPVGIYSDGDQAWREPGSQLLRLVFCSGRRGRLGRARVREKGA